MGMTTRTATIITMTDAATLARLMTWLSPAFPVGAFAYSHGLERAIHDGVIRDRTSLVEWLETLLERGSAWNDAVLLAEAWRCAQAGDGLGEVAELAEAMSASRERHMETTLQGGAFVDAMAAWSGAQATGETGQAHGACRFARGTLSPVGRGQGEGAPPSAERSLPLTRSAAPTRPLPTGERVSRADAPYATAYPVAVGAAAARHGAGLDAALTGRVPAGAHRHLAGSAASP